MPDEARNPPPACLTEMSTMNDDSLDALAALLRAADGDAVFREQVRALLLLPSFQRASIVNTSVEEMVLRGEPEDVCSAFRLLASDASAEIAFRYLSRFYSPA